MDRIPQSVMKRVTLKAYLASDHFSPATGKTIAVVISKNGGAFANPSGGATNATEIANGWYYVDLSTTDTGTAGPLIVRGTAATVDDVETSFEVANAFNAGFTGVPGVAAEGAGGLYTRGSGAGQINQSANGQIDVNAERLNNVAQSLLDLKDFADDGYDPATNKVQGLVLADTTTAVTNRVTANTDQIEGTDATTYFDSIVTAVAVAVWAAGTRTLTSFGTLVADVATAVWGAVTRSLTDKADFTLTAAYDAAKTASQAGDAMSLTTGERTTLTAVIWDALVSGFVTVGSIGKRIVDFLDVAVSSRLATASYTTPPTVGLIADQVWDEAIAGHVGAGSTGEALTVAAAGAAAAPTAAQIADKVLGRNLAGGSDGGRTVQDALRSARNKVTIVGSTVTVFEEDDTTPAWTGALTTNPSADPITAVDPT